MMTVNIGDKAPEFTLFNTEKQPVNLKDYQGKKVVLLFFPLAFTGTCTTELCSVRDNLSQYDALNAQVLAVSVDSLFALGRFKKDQSLNFPLLSDFNKDISRAYGSLYDSFVFDMQGVSKRAAFVIDTNGYIKYAEVLDVSTDLPDFDLIQKALQ